MADVLPHPFLINGPAAASSTVLILLFVKDTASSEETGEDSGYQSAEDKSSIAKVLRENPTLLLCFLISALYAAACKEFSDLLPIDLRQIHGAQGSSIAGTVMPLNGLPVVVLTPLLTKMSGRITDPVKYLAGTALTAASFLLLVFFMGSIPVCCVMAFLLTAGDVICSIAEGSRIFRSIAVGASEWYIGRAYDRNGSESAWMITVTLTAPAVFLCFIWIPSERTGTHLNNGTTALKKCQ